MFSFPHKCIIQGRVGGSEFQNGSMFYPFFLFSATIVREKSVCTWNNGLPKTSLSPTSRY